MNKIFILAAALLLCLPGPVTSQEVQGVDMAGTWLIKREKTQVRVMHEGQGYRFEKRFFNKGVLVVKKGGFNVEGSRIIFVYDSGTRTSGILKAFPQMVEASTQIWEKIPSQALCSDIKIQGNWNQFNNGISLWQDGHRVLGEKFVGGKLYSRLAGEIDGCLVSLKETFDTIQTGSMPFHTLLYRDDGCLIQSTTRGGRDTCWTRVRR